MPMTDSDWRTTSSLAIDWSQRTEEETTKLAKPIWKQASLIGPPWPKRRPLAATAKMQPAPHLPEKDTTVGQGKDREDDNMKALTM